MKAKHISDGRMHHGYVIDHAAYAHRARNEFVEVQTLGQSLHPALRESATPFLAREQPVEHEGDLTVRPSGSRRLDDDLLQRPVVSKNDVIERPDFGSRPRAEPHANPGAMQTARSIECSGRSFDTVDRWSQCLIEELLRRFVRGAVQKQDGHGLATRNRFAGKDVEVLCMRVVLNDEQGRHGTFADE
ncbi:hypothetical protein CBA19CS22_33140 [Caballeronia novacaledonica]|uniref:Uncharacterized protein n=1 Tax=Caballeronia novacaledonica TaxID=1544861 RepID=A0ACB5R2R1_9BURK|nr:hypothetical protein CBA19CS22_33140 [Caballeronia novacaledonica]